MALTSNWVYDSAPARNDRFGLLRCKLDDLFGRIFLIHLLIAREPRIGTYRLFNDLFANHRVRNFCRCHPDNGPGIINMRGLDQLDDPVLMACTLCIGRAPPVKSSTSEENIQVDGKEGWPSNANSYSPTTSYIARDSVSRPVDWEFSVVSNGKRACPRDGELILARARSGSTEIIDTGAHRQLRQW